MLMSKKCTRCNCVPGIADFKSKGYATCTPCLQQKKSKRAATQGALIKNNQGEICPRKWKLRCVSQVG